MEFFGDFVTDKNDDDISNRNTNASAMLSRNMDAGELEEVITEDEVRHSKNCSPGMNVLCIEMFKATANTIVPFLTLIFNNIYMYNRGALPACWSESIIVLLYKKGSKSDP